MKVQLGAGAHGDAAQGPPGGVEGWRAVVGVLRSPVAALDDVITTVFPADCRCCEGPLVRAGLVPVCAACVERVRPAGHLGCRRCGEAINLDLDMEDVRFAGMLAEGLLCRECRLAAPEFARAVAFGDYEGELRRLVHLLKFERVRGVARLLAPQMAEAMLQLEPAAAAAAELMVIAVPLFAARERQRGYNQSTLLADEALRLLRRSRPAWKLRAAHGAMERRRKTESSYVLSPRGRRQNLRGAFHVTGEVRGREVLLVDDILTSGATARECARVLMRAGAAKVWVATLARAQKQHIVREQAGPEELVARWDLAGTSGLETATSGLERATSGLGTATT